MTVLNGRVTVNSSVNESSDRELDELAEAIIDSIAGE